MYHLPQNANKLDVLINTDMSLTTDNKATDAIRALGHDTSLVFKPFASTYLNVLESGHVDSIMKLGAGGMSALTFAPIPSGLPTTWTAMGQPATNEPSKRESTTQKPTTEGLML